MRGFRNLEIEIFIDKGLTRFKDFRVFGLRDWKIKRFRDFQIKGFGNLGI